MKTIFSFLLVLFFVVQSHAQTNYDSLIVGSWKRIGFSTLTNDTVFITDAPNISSFFSNHKIQNIHRDSLPYREDSCLKYYINFSLGFIANTEWKIKNRKIYIDKNYEGEIKKITRDTLILYNKHEGGVYEKYVRIPSLKLYQDYEIDQLNEKEETFLKHKVWYKNKTQLISFSDTEYFEINKMKKISSIVYGKGTKFQDWLNKVEYDSLKLYYYRDGVLTEFEHQTLYKGTNICYTRHSFKDKSFWYVTSDQNEYRNDREELLIGNKWIKVYEEKKSSNTDFSKPLVVYDTLKYHNEFGEISKSTIYKIIYDTIYRTKRKNYTSFQIIEKTKTLSDTSFEYATSSTGKRFHSISYIKENFTYEKSKEKHSTTTLKFTPDGDVEIKIIFNKNGKVVQIILYYKNGVKLQEPEIIQGDGKYTYCNPDGKLCCECEIINGKIKNCHPIK